METGELNTLDLGSAEPTPETGAAELANETEIEVEDVGSQNPDEETEGNEAPEGQDEDDPWKGYVEVEVNGKKYKVPDEIKDGYLRTDDYTRKRQADAEFKRSLDAKAAEVEKLREVGEEELQARSAKMGIEHQLKQYENADWAAEYEKDPFGTQQHFMRYQQMKDAHAKIEQFIGQAETQRTEAAERDYATRVQETRKHAQANLKGWNDDLDKRLETFVVKDMGYTPEEVRKLINPKNYELIYYAHIGKQTLSKQSAPQKPTPIPPKPLTTVTAKGGSVRKTPATMSVAEMDAYLNKRS